MTKGLEDQLKKIKKKIKEYKQFFLECSSSKNKKSEKKESEKKESEKKRVKKKSVK